MPNSKTLKKKEEKKQKQIKTSEKNKKEKIPFGARFPPLWRDD